jgi:hypothetical protein
MDQNNWLFFTIIESKRTSDMILSIKKTSELNNLNTRNNFAFLFDDIPILIVFLTKKQLRLIFNV